VPQIVKIVDQLDKTSVGKLNKKRLREQFACSLERKATA